MLFVGINNYYNTCYMHETRKTEGKDGRKRYKRSKEIKGYTMGEFKHQRHKDILHEERERGRRKEGLRISSSLVHLSLSLPSLLLVFQALDLVLELSYLLLELVSLFLQLVLL